MKTIRSAEEKEQLVRDFKSSGLSLVAWCKSNNIPRSTMSGWIYGKNNNDTCNVKRAKFIEITPVITHNKKQDSFIAIEHGDFKITVDENTDFKLLENTLRVVVRLNV